MDSVVTAWHKLDQDVIRKSLRVCGAKAIPSSASGRGSPTLVDGRLSPSSDSCVKRCQAAQDEENKEELFNNKVVLTDNDEEYSDNAEDCDFEEEDSDYLKLHH